MADTTNGEPPDWSAYGEETHVKQKRARGQLSCVPCRVGKLKCNRVRDPGCDQCIKRNRQDACHYVPPPSKARPPANVKGRIRQLESLVRNLMEKQNGQGDDDVETPSDDEEAESAAIGKRVEQSFGKLEINQDEISYQSQEHWQAILSSLDEIQKELGDDEDSPSVPSLTSATLTPASSTPGAASSIGDHGLLGSTRPMTREELLLKVPDKKTTDRLLSLWFNSPDPFKVLIHAPTFQEEYKKLWQDQDVTDMWLGLFFAILCLAESFGLRHADSAEAETCSAKVSEYHALAASAAVLADYTKPKAYTLECLLLYMIGIRGPNASLNAWLIMGMIVRLALRMGYHRDPDYYSAKVTAYEGEMRRRVWAIVFMIDVLMSFQLGLPSMVRMVAADTQPPKNLLDRDFAVKSGFLPASRGDSELTPCLYVRAKLRLIAVFSEAAELSHATTPPTQEAVLKLDRDLERARDEIPPLLQLSDVSEVVTDPAEQLMCRFNLDLLYLKTKMVLFRRFMLVPIGQLTEHEQTRGIGAGREACIKSARRTLNHHHTIYSATRPGGQMEHMKWYMGSISTHDFLLAAMVLCLELSQQLQKDKMLRISNGMQCPTRTAMMNALEQTHKIWSTSASETNENTLIGSAGPKAFPGYSKPTDTAKAAKAMALMLARLKQQRGPASVAPSPGDFPPDCTESGKQLFVQLGVTPEGARAIRKNGAAFHGVLPNQGWDSGVPADFVFPSPESHATPESYQPPTGAGPTAQWSFPAPPMDMRGSLGDSYAMPNDGSEADWQTWGYEIMNAPNAQEMDWLGQDLLASDFTTMANDQLMSGVGDISLPQDVYGSAAEPHIDARYGDLSSFDFGSTVFTPFMSGEASKAWPERKRS